MLPDLVAREVIDVGPTGLDEPHRALIEAIEIVRRVVIPVVPVNAEPANILLDRSGERLVLCLRIGIVHPEVTDAAILFSDPEIEVNSFGMADVQIPVRFGRKTRVHSTTAAVCTQIVGHDLTDEITACEVITVHHSSRYAAVSVIANARSTRLRHA